MEHKPEVAKYAIYAETSPFWMSTVARHCNLIVLGFLSRTAGFFNLAIASSGQGDW